MVSPSSVNTRVMPTLRPTSPKLMILLPFYKGADCNWSAIQKIKSETARAAVKCETRTTLHISHFTFHALQLNFHVHAGGQIELHQRIDRLVGGINNIHQPQMRADFELVARRLVDVRRAQNIETLLARRQRYRSFDDRAGTFGGIDNFERRLIDQPIVERLQANANLLAFDSGHCRYSITLATTPAPTVRPPSRMANRKPSSIAISGTAATEIDTLSPGITISVPC